MSSKSLKEGFTQTVSLSILGSYFTKMETITSEASRNNKCTGVGFLCTLKKEGLRLENFMKENQLS